MKSYNQSSPREHGDAVELSQLVTFDTIKDIQTGLVELRKIRDQLVRTHKDLLTATGRGDRVQAEDTIDRLNKEYRQHFATVEDLVKREPSGGVQIQLELQRKYLRGERREYLKAVREASRNESRQQQGHLHERGVASNEETAGPRLQTLERAGATQARKHALTRSGNLRAIEWDFEELYDLTKDIQREVDQQQPSLVQTVDRVEQTKDAIEDANKNLDSAIKSSRGWRKWKWYVLIIVIILGSTIIAIAVTQTRRTSPSTDTR